eukprot:5162672-Pyramimonas_sp.AAC.1
MAFPRETSSKQMQCAISCLPTQIGGVLRNIPKTAQEAFFICVHIIYSNAFQPVRSTTCASVKTSSNLAWSSSLLSSS